MNKLEVVRLGILGQRVTFSSLRPIQAILPTIGVLGASLLVVSRNICHVVVILVIRIAHPLNEIPILNLSIRAEDRI